MSMKFFAVSAGLGSLMAAGPVAYHSRDIDFYTQDTARVEVASDGPHLIVEAYDGENLADIPLQKDQNGALTGRGTVMGDEFQASVQPDEVLFVHDHGVEKLWMGRDVVHVRTAAEPDVVLE